MKYEKDRRESFIPHSLNHFDNSGVRNTEHRTFTMTPKTNEASTHQDSKDDDDSDDDFWDCSLVNKNKGFTGSSLLNLLLLLAPFALVLVVKRLINLEKQ